MELKQSDKFHFYARAAFFAHKNELPVASNARQMVEKFMKRQVVKPLTFDLPEMNLQKFSRLSKSQKKELKREWRKHVQEINATWIRKMTDLESGLVEKMTLLWHGHFACRTVDNPYQALDLNNRLRTNALGNFKTLLMAVSTSKAMINYLHLKQNKKGKPNEDFARELCELFALGRDVDYTEKDVTEIARAFTGWTYDANGNHLVNPRQHDSGIKTIFGKTGNFGGVDVIDMILENKNTARFIAKKVYRFFVREKVNEQHVDELATVFFETDYDIQEMMKHLFQSAWFYQAKGERIKSPIDLIVSFGRIFELKYPDSQTLVRVQRYLGQVLFDPPNVAGWAGGRSWVDSSRLAFRLRMGSMILNNGAVDDLLSPELDEMITKKQRKKKRLKLSEEIDWDRFFAKNKGAKWAEVLLRTENTQVNNLKGDSDFETIIQLVSTPDFQLT